MSAAQVAAVILILQMVRACGLERSTHITTVQIIAMRVATTVE